jgi:pimeloyl-ACP methyl ester carboxylesterase
VRARHAAGLPLSVLGLAPGAIVGTSSGGVFALAMVIRHRRSVRGAILHEPALVALFDDPAQTRDTVTAVIEEGMRSGGRRLALERFVRLVAGDANWDALDPSLRARMLSSADTYFEVEIGRFDTYLPDDAALATNEVPVQLIVSEASLP